MSFKAEFFKTIQDFDLGMSEDLTETVRVTSLENISVTSNEVKLIIWILLEKSWEKDELDAESDETDGTVDTPGHRSIQTDGRRSDIRRAKRYNMDLLKVVGVNVPFELLTDAEKSRLLEEFSASSQLTSKKQFKSIYDLYEGLRRRSKFREQYETMETIGKGRYGEVIKVKVKDSGQLKAIKRILPALDCLEDIRMIISEADSLRMLNGHPNIVRFYDSWLATDSDDIGYSDDRLVFYLEMELCSESLKKWKDKLAMKGKPDVEDFENVCVVIFEQILDALKYIHLHRIVHLDLNPSNIFWKDETLTCVKIGDFGLAVHGDEVEGRRGTSPYCAPEKTLTAKSDVYSAGVTIFEVAALTKTIVELADRLEKMHVTTNMVIMDTLVPKMLLKNPSERPTASEALEIISQLKSSSS